MRELGQILIAGGCGALIRDARGHVGLMSGNAELKQLVVRRNRSYMVRRYPTARIDQ